MPLAPSRAPVLLLLLLLRRAAAVLVAALLLGLTGAVPTVPASAATGRDFVQRNGSTLTQSGAPFRFSGSDIYWLGLDDNVRDAQGPTYPTRFRVDDAFRATQAAGGTVVRTWGGFNGCDRCIQPRLGEFQESAFAPLDYAVAAAARHDQRLIISLVDNWDYYHGSKRTYTAWRGLPESAFFSDPRVIADYQNYITRFVQHVNPLTGLRYADDPTIMAWETGNEMWCETCAGNAWDGSWTRSIAEHLQAVAPRQLVVDGHGTDPACTSGCLHEPSLDIDAVDLVDDHFYPMQLPRLRSSAATAARHGKAYLVGEYDWNNHRGGTPLAEFLATARSAGVAGALLWSVVPHADDSGFVDHDDGFQYFFPGRDADEIARTATLQAFARSMGTVLTRPGAPPAPCGVRTARTAAGTAIWWRGAAPAVRYVVQRRTVGSAGTSWRNLTWSATDTARSGPAGFVDPAVLLAPQEFRVAGISAAGVRGTWSAPGRAGAPGVCAG